MFFFAVHVVKDDFSLCNLGYKRDKQGNDAFKKCIKLYCTVHAVLLEIYLGHNLSALESNICLKNPAHVIILRSCMFSQNCSERGHKK